jgi:NAD(P)H-nitrite reductase large subunit
VHKGAVLMNVLSTLDLISVSYGLWDGKEGGETSYLSDPEKFKYIRLQFDGDQLVGANTLGITQNIGALRGLIQSETKLGFWKQRLMDNPLQFMDAYVAVTGRHT